MNWDSWDCVLVVGGVGCRGLGSVFGVRCPAAPGIPRSLRSRPFRPTKGALVAHEGGAAVKGGVRLVGVAPRHPGHIPLAVLAPLS